MDHRRPVTQIHLGGGTPTFFPPSELRRLGALIHEHFNVSPDVEFSVEVDPRRITLDHVTALREIGVNRASIGVQDTNPQVQLAIHRFQPQHMNQQAFAWMRKLGIASINVDLIYGLPLQTPSSFAQTIDEVHFAEPRPALGVQLRARSVDQAGPADFRDPRPVAGAEEKLAMFGRRRTKAHRGWLSGTSGSTTLPARRRLAVAQRAGTLHRNFQGYSTQADASLYSFGVSSISSTPDSYRQNHRTLEAWRAALAAGQLPTDRGLRLTAEDQRRRTIIMRLMCDRRLDFGALSRQLGLDFARTYSTELASLDDLEADGLVQRQPDGILVTPAGGPLLRVIAMRFDEHFLAAAKKHSQVI
jgi:oxygen-independent coproporphyrinogen-3 oxidase